MQEDERRIASVIARKEEEKRRENNKIQIMKVGNIFSLVCVWFTRNIEEEWISALRMLLFLLRRLGVKHFF